MAVITCLRGSAVDSVGVLCGSALQMAEAGLVPVADSDEHDDSEERCEGEPC